MNNLQVKGYPSLTGFGGINTGKAPFNITDTEATEMMNVSSDDFPALSQPKGKAEVMSGMVSIVYIGTLFDGKVFCIGKKSGDTGNKIYYYDESSQLTDKWGSVTLGTGVGDLITGNNFTAANFINENTVIASGSNLISIAAGVPYNAEKITVSGAMPASTNFVVSKDDRLACANLGNSELAISELRLIQYEEPIDYYIISAETNNGENTTGLALYGDMIIWFKKSATIIINGKSPNSYGWDIMTRSIGCVENKTVAETNTALMWLASDGVYAYSATTLPYKISEPIKKYIDNHSGNAAAGSDGRKYYLSLQQTDNSYVLCVYDTQTKQWNIEENAGYTLFLRKDNTLYASDGEHIYKLNSADFGGSWLFVTKPFDLAGASGKMNLYRLYFNIRAKKGATLDISLSPDISSNKFINVHRQTFLRDFDGKIPIYLRPNADLRDMSYFRVKMSGRNECRIYALEVQLRAKRGTY